MYLSHEFGTAGILHGVYCIARLHTNAHQYSDNIVGANEGEGEENKHVKLTKTSKLNEILLFRNNN